MYSITYPKEYKYNDFKKLKYYDKYDENLSLKLNAIVDWRLNVFEMNENLLD